MLARRGFLHLLGLSAALPALARAAVPAAPPADAAPVLISTWGFGQAANAAAWQVLGKGGAALDAVEAGARVPEADPANHSVGLGGYPDRDGHVTLDACVMDHLGNLGSVACLEDIVHAVSVARRVMEKTPHVLLVGEGALQFALSEGFPRQDLLTPEAEQAWRAWLKTAQYRPQPNIERSNRYEMPGTVQGGERNHDTIGILALDHAGHLAGACTTSGMAFKMRGRVGDSPISGAGLFVDGEVGAASATGVGEECLRVCGSHTVVELMRQGRAPGQACREAIERIARRYPTPPKDLQMAFVALDRHGRYGGYALQPGFSYAVRTSAGDRLVEAESLA
jgi:N4-(beta-N-acetylglucosaminyl)-L-asparaginase